MSRALLILAIFALFSAYPATYATLRLTHSFVHEAIFISEEGENAHTWHSMTGHEQAQKYFTPFITAELSFWQRWRP